MHIHIFSHEGVSIISSTRGGLVLTMEHTTKVCGQTQFGGQPHKFNIYRVLSTSWLCSQ